ncbi:MAG: hypothetical protein AAGA70_02460 [Pseudomonadota bacterium]
MANKKDIQRQIDAEAEKLAEFATTTNDPLIKAKAIAMRQEEVRKVIFERVEAGQRLVNATAMQGNPRGRTDELPDITVFFRFQAGDSLVSVFNTGFAAVYERRQFNFEGIIDPFELQPEHEVARPFVLANAASWERHARVRPEDPVAQQREVAFFEALSLANFVNASGAAPATYVDSIGGTTTSSGDTRSDGPYCEYHDDRLTITIVG